MISHSSNISSYDSEMKEKDDIDGYMERFSKLPPEKILRYLGEMREFFLKNMTEDGKGFFTHQFTMEEPR